MNDPVILTAQSERRCYGKDTDTVTVFRDENGQRWVPVDESYYELYSGVVKMEDRTHNSSKSSS